MVQLLPMTIKRINILKLSKSFLQSQLCVVLLIILLSIIFKDFSFLSLKLFYTPIIYTYFTYNKNVKTFIISGFLDGICSEVLKLIQINQFNLNIVFICLYLLFLSIVYFVFLKYLEKDSI